MKCEATTFKYIQKDNNECATCTAADIVARESGILHLLFRHVLKVDAMILANRRIVHVQPILGALAYSRKREFLNEDFVESPEALTFIAYP